MQLIGRFDPSQPHYFSTLRPRQGLFFSLQIYKYYRKNTNIPPLFYIPPLFCRFYSAEAYVLWMFSPGIIHRMRPCKMARHSSAVPG